MSFKPDLNRLTQDELREIGAGKMKLLDENTSFFHSSLYPELRKLASRIMMDVYPLTEDQKGADAFLLSPEQVYYRAQIIESLQTILSSKEDTNAKKS